jgi:DnaJ-domain-containing protein 1
MDIIDRLSDLLKSLFGDESERTGTPGTASRYADPDVTEAWEELDEYLRTGKNGPKQGGSGGGKKTGRTQGPLDEDLRRDYANLEVPFGADMEEIKKAYKTLILRYHPDKHSGDPEKLRIATEITKKINESFERIRSRAEGSKRG